MSLPDTEHVPPMRHLPQARPLRTASTVIYATLLLLTLFIPQALSNWLKAFEPNAAQSVLLDAALAVQAFSNRMGLNWAYYESRRLFLDATGKQDE